MVLYLDGDRGAEEARAALVWTPLSEVIPHQFLGGCGTQVRSCGPSQEGAFSTAGGEGPTYEFQMSLMCVTVT